MTTLARLRVSPGDRTRDVAGDAVTDLGIGRIHALSDGLFAISLTLLAIDLRLPEFPAAASSVALTHAIEDLIPKVLPYALSFTVISFHWVAHLRRSALIERADARLAYLNLLLLAFIALIPLPTSVIGEHGDLPIAVVLYAVALSAAGLAGFVSWAHAIRAGLVRHGAPADLVGSGAVRGLIPAVVMLGSLVLLPFTSTYLVEASWALILPILWATGRRTANARPGLRPRLKRDGASRQDHDLPRRPRSREAAR